MGALQWHDSMEEWNSIPDRTATLHDQYEIAKERLDSAFDEVIKALEDAKSRKVVQFISFFTCYFIISFQIAELEEARLRQEHAIDDLYRKMYLNEARVKDAMWFVLC